MFNKFESFLRKKVVKQNTQAETLDSQFSHTPSVSLQDLYDRYGYIPESEKRIERVNLNINWPEDINSKIENAVDRILKRISIAPAVEVININDGVTLKLSMEEGYGKRSVKMALVDEGAKTKIAELDCYMIDSADTVPSKAEYWDLGHRVVDERYRGQGIGTKMINALEHSLQHLANLDQRTQVITLKAFQLGVLNMALKLGYIPASTQDRSKVQDIYSFKLDKFFVTTIHGIGNRGIRRPGVVYSMDVLRELAFEAGLGDLSDDQVRSMGVDPIFRGNYNAYMNYAFNIQLKKEKTPRPMQ